MSLVDTRLKGNLEEPVEKENKKGQQLRQCRRIFENIRTETKNSTARKRYRYRQDLGHYND